MDTIHYDTDDIAADYLDAHAYDYDDIPRREVLDPRVCSITIDHDFYREDLTFLVHVRTRDAVLRSELFQAFEFMFTRFDPSEEPNPPRYDCTDNEVIITLPAWCMMPDEFVGFLSSHAAFANTLRDAFADKRGALWNLAERLPYVEELRIEDLEEARSGRLNVILPSCERNLELVRREIECTSRGIKLVNDAIAFLDKRANLALVA